MRDAQQIELELKSLFEVWAKEKCEMALPLAPSGSKRVYYKLSGQSKTLVGSYNPIVEENRAFIYFSKHFLDKGVFVPEIYKVSEDELFYLQEDLGFTTLYSLSLIHI